MLNSFKLFRVPIRLLILLFPLAVCGLHLIRGFSFFFPFLFLVLVRGELATWETVFGVFSLSCQGVCKEFGGGALVGQCGHPSLEYESPAPF